MDQLQNDMAAAGLEDVNIIIGVDFTASNTSTGRVSRGGLSLHFHSPDNPSPYASVMQLITSVFARRFDVDQLVPLFGFGDSGSGGKRVFSMSPPGATAVTVDMLVDVYAAHAQVIRLAGPTCFAPLIAHACDIVAATGYRYHMLVIITDGMVQDAGETALAIAAASKFPLSIVIVGVGDGPFSAMQTFDDAVPRRDFDNVQFVQYTIGMNALEFCKKAVGEVVDQYAAIRALRLMTPTPRLPLFATGEGALVFPRPTTGSYCL